MGLSDRNSKKIRVLVVDDEPVVAESLTRILALYGYHADFVLTPSEAIERSLTEPFDLLVTDVVLDGQISGIDAAIEIYKTLPNCKVLLMSGNNATAELLKKAREQGYDFDILPKPVHPTAILEKLKAMAAALPV